MTKETRHAFEVFFLSKSRCGIAEMEAEREARRGDSYLGSFMGGGPTAVCMYCH